MGVLPTGSSGFRSFLNSSGFISQSGSIKIISGKPMIFRLDHHIAFPNPELAEEDGLLAVGGDLSVARLILAYQNGIFPWYSDDTPILWYSPHKRFVLFTDKINVSRSMTRAFKQFRITYDTDFKSVIESCASVDRKDQDGTWITTDMQNAYIKLHQAGHAHSVEVWKDDVLVGGMYGVAVNGVFCGESMFSRVSNASKAALIWLCQNKDFKMIDCQIHSEHLESMGAGMISREEFQAILDVE
jgi:leucyl/phenylalanyl-tRNA--protein transferase